jgi:hypothetical protein
MPRATLPPPARLLAVFAAGLLVATGALLGVGTPRAEAAKPCWERAIDDWVDNGRIDGVYSASCITAARKHVPEDIRAYTDIIDKLDSYRLNTVRSLESTSGPDAKPPATNDRRVPTPEPRTTNGKDEAPIPYVLGKGTTDASSIPVPLMVLAGLALLLMTAGAAGFAQRKLAARRISSRDG